MAELRLTPKRLEEYLQLRRQGVLPYAAARGIGVDPATIRRYRGQHPEFRKAIEEAEQEAIEAVEDALFQAATSGNVTAIQVFLYNRAPDRWRDMRSVEIAHVGRRDELIHSIATKVVSIADARAQRRGVG